MLYQFQAFSRKNISTHDISSFGVFLDSSPFTNPLGTWHPLRKPLHARALRGRWQNGPCRTTEPDRAGYSGEWACMYTSRIFMEFHGHLTDVTDVTIDICPRNCGTKKPDRLLSLAVVLSFLHLQILLLSCSIVWMGVGPNFTEVAHTAELSIFILSMYPLVIWPS